MKRTQFRVLFRQFLFRMVDLELLSSQGDVNQLLGQFAALLIWMSSLLFLGGLMTNAKHVPGAFWGTEHALIATTMLIVGIFAVVSWETTFPNRNDVLVLAPLPLRARTLFMAKVASLGAALGLTVACFNGPLSLSWPLFDFFPAGTGILGSLRSFAAWWITVLAAGAFVFCSVLGLQGLAAQLPRRFFLRLSSALQMGAFGMLLVGYFLEPRLATPEAVAAPANAHALASWPTYWFLGLFQDLNGSRQPGTGILSGRAVFGLAIAAALVGIAFLLSYFRTLRRIVEEPDIVPGAHGATWLPRFGNSFETAIVQFSIRSLMRSRQHRVVLAFYLGIAFALVALGFQGPPIPAPIHGMAAVSVLPGSLLVLCFWVVGTRMVIAMPLDLKANWIFRTTGVWGPVECLKASRRALVFLAVAPVWVGTAALLLWLWPWRPALQHLLIFGLLGLALADIGLWRFRKLPFTCSYLPGKSRIHLAFIGGMGLILVTTWFAQYELTAFVKPLEMIKTVVAFAAAAAIARRISRAAAEREQSGVAFEDVPPPAVQTLGLNRDGVVPLTR